MRSRLLGSHLVLPAALVIPWSGFASNALGGGVIQCPPGAIIENEPDCGDYLSDPPNDTVNGGCNSSPPVFTPITRCGTVCGTAAESPNGRDTDWYEIVTTEDAAFTWTVTSSFNSHFGLIQTTPMGSGDCSTRGFLNVEDFGVPFTPLTITTPMLGAGRYWFFVATDFSGNVACPADYVATLRQITSTKSFASGNVGLSMPDNNPTGISHSINVPEAFNVEDVNVLLNITHTFVGDLCITLTHNGVTAQLAMRMGADTGVACHAGEPFGCGQDNFVNLVLDDEAFSPIESACAANLTGRFSPHSPLSIFDGMNTAGSWTLTVVDNAGGDLGTLDNWSLTFPKADGGPCDTCLGDIDGDGAVDFDDFTNLLAQFGSSCPCTADLDGDDDVDFDDFTTLLANYGPCP